jgi:DNA-binding GntR family transcriptional regulator
MGESSIVWIELYDELRSRIKAGELRAEAEIDKTNIAANISDSDFKRAVERLVEEGVLNKDAYNGLIVAARRARSRRSASFQNDYEAQGRSPSTRTITLDLMPIEEAPDFVQESLKDSECSILVRHYHLQSVDGIPHAIADSYIPYELIGKRWKEIKSGNHDVFKVLSDLGYSVTEKQETLYVDAPTLSEREQLGILAMPGLQIVRLDCILWSGAEIVEVCLLCDRADLYEFTYRIKV